MAVLGIVGFETGDLSETAAIAGTLAVVTSPAGMPGTYSLQVNPTTTAVGNYRVSTAANTGKHADLNIATAYLTFKFMPTTLPSADYEQIVRFLNTALGVKGSVAINSSGQLMSLSTTNSVLATGSTSLATGTMYRIGVVCPTTTSGDMLIYLNGVLEVTGNGSFTATNHQRVQMGKIQDLNGETVDFHYKDIVLCDDALRYYKVWPPAVPIASGAAAGWTNGTGTTFAEADEVPPNTTDYIQAADTEDNQDHTFAMTTAATIGFAAPFITKTIVRALTATTAGTSTVAVRYIVDGTPIELTAMEMTTGYINHSVIDEDNPVDASAWDTTSFDSLEVGMAANTLDTGATQRFTVAYVMVATPETVPATMGAKAMYYRRRRI